MGAGPIRALTGGRRTKPTSTGCRRLRQPEPGRRSTYQAGEPVQTNRASSNNYTNRTEEAIGSATDLWTAYREGAFKPSPRPWVGYLMLLEEASQSTQP